MKKNYKKYIWIGVAVLFVLLVIGSYNGLVKAAADVEESWANVETQYQRRADLIPNLIEVVKESASFQESLFVEVTALRSQWQSAKSAGNRAEQVEIGETMGSALSRLIVTVENYPDLDLETFKNLQAQLEGTENRVAVARTRYNEEVKEYNVKIRRFPTVIMANLFGFEREEFFESDEGTETVPVVNFN